MRSVSQNKRAAEALKAELDSPIPCFGKTRGKKIQPSWVRRWGSARPIVFGLTRCKERRGNIDEQCRVMSELSKHSSSLHTIVFRFLLPGVGRFFTGVPTWSRDLKAEGIGFVTYPVFCWTARSKCRIIPSTEESIAKKKQQPSETWRSTIVSWHSCHIRLLLLFFLLPLLGFFG